jgi:hypothetical protein
VLQSALPFAGSGFVYRGCLRGRDKALIFCLQKKINRQGHEGHKDKLCFGGLSALMPSFWQGRDIVGLILNF